MKGSRKILWVDDDPATNEAFRDEIEEAGYLVDCARNPDEMWMFLSKHPDAYCGIIMDVLMPIGDTVDAERANGGLKTGLVLIEQLRVAPEFRSVPVLIFTIRATHDVDDFGEKYAISVLRKQETTPRVLRSMIEVEFGNNAY